MPAISWRGCRAMRDSIAREPSARRSAKRTTISESRVVASSQEAARCQELSLTPFSFSVLLVLLIHHVEKRFDRNLHGL